MNTTLVKGLHKLSINGGSSPSTKGDSLLPTLSSSSDKHNPSDHDYIKYLDYPALEANYNIHKYVPSYIHNGEIATPIIRDLIVDKPIYSAANSHVKKKKKKKKKDPYAIATKRIVHEHAQEAKKQYREEKKALHQEQKTQRKELRNKFRCHGDHTRNVPEEPYERDTFNFNKDLDDFSFNSSYTDGKTVFNDPFEPSYNNYTTRMDRRASSVTLINSIPSVGNSGRKRHNSIATKLRHLVKGSSDEDSTPVRVRSNNRADDSLSTPPSEEDPQPYTKQETKYFNNPLNKSNSFDQTKSSMTNLRKKNDGIKKKFLRLAHGSEPAKNHRDIGMYMDFLRHF